jgi:hypothetical protein
MAGVDLTVIEGISETTALVVLSEIGSAGKIFSRRVRRGANRAARALRMAGQGCHHAKNARSIGAFKHTAVAPRPSWQPRGKSRSGRFGKPALTWRHFG